MIGMIPFEMKILLSAVMILTLGGCDESSKSAETCKFGATAPCACHGGGTGTRQCTDRGIWSAICESCDEVDNSTVQIPLDCQEGESRPCACPGSADQTGVQGCESGFWSPCAMCPTTSVRTQPADSALDIGQRCTQDAECQSQTCIRHSQGDQVALSGYCYKKCETSADCQLAGGIRLDCVEVSGSGKTCAYGCGGTSGAYNCRGGDSCLTFASAGSACFFPASSRCFNGASRCVSGDAGAIEVCLSGAYQKGRCDGIGGNSCQDNRCTAVAWHCLSDGNLCFGADPAGIILPIGCAMKTWNNIRLENGSWIFIDRNNRCLEIQNGLAKDGAPLVVADCTNAPQQMWLLNFSTPKNAMEIESILKPASAKFCIDYKAADQTNPAGRIFTFGCFQGDNQYWRTWAK